MPAPKVLLEVALVSFLVLSLLVIPAAFAAVHCPNHKIKKESKVDLSKIVVERNYRAIPEADGNGFVADGKQAYPTSRLLDGSRDHGAAEEWAEDGTIDIKGIKHKARLIYIFDEDDINCGSEEDEEGGEHLEAEHYPWERCARRIEVGDEI